jgi:hypothetical protein
MGHQRVSSTIIFFTHAAAQRFAAVRSALVGRDADDACSVSGGMPALAKYFQGAEQR